MELRELQQLLFASSRYAVKRFIKDIAPAPLLKQAEAHRLFGRGNVERWLAEGTIEKKGKRFSREQLETVAARLNRVSYLTVKERNPASQNTVDHE